MRNIVKRKKVKTSYISPLPRKIEKVFSQFKDFDRNAASSKTKKIKILADSLEGCKTSYLTITTHATSEQQLTIPAENVEIMTDLDILALGSVEFLLPEFKNLSLLVQIQICDELGFTKINPVICISNSKYKHKLNQLKPSRLFPIPKDGNCLFTTLTYLITGSIDNYHKMRLSITNNMMGRFHDVCHKFIRNKFPRSVINYRNTKDYLIK